MVVGDAASAAADQVPWVGPPPLFSALEQFGFGESSSGRVEIPGRGILSTPARASANHFRVGSQFENAMNGAIVGYGTVAMGHMAGYSQLGDVSIRAVVDPCRGRRDHCRSVFPAVDVFACIEDLFARHSLDFVDICAPPHTHSQYILAGLAHGCHVLCEKPFLLSVDEYRDLQTAITGSGCVVYPCHNYKFSPAMTVVRRLVADGELGDILRGHLRTLRAGHALGVREWKPHWRRLSRYSGGGILRDHGTHSIYLACGIAGRQLKEVSCITGNVSGVKHRATEDTALLTLEFEEGVVFVIDLSWASAQRYTSYTFVGARRSILVENDLVCTTGVNGSIQRLTINSDFDDPSHKSWFVGMFNDFLNLVTNRDGQQLLIDEALVTTLVIDAAYKSAKAGGARVRITLPLSSSNLSIATRFPKDAFATHAISQLADSNQPSGPAPERGSAIRADGAFAKEPL